MTSTTGTRLYLVYYGMPSTFQREPVVQHDRPATRGGSVQKPKQELYNVSPEQIKKAHDCHSQFENDLRQTKWQLRSYTMPSITIDLQWENCTDEDMIIMEKDCPDPVAMEQLYPFRHLNKAKLKIAQVPQNFTTPEWQIGSVYFGPNLDRKYCNFVLLTDTQFRCLNGLVLSKNCEGPRGKFTWQFENIWDAHGIVSADPIQLVTAQYNWSKELNSSFKNLKFIQPKVTEQLNTETGEMELVSDGVLSAKVGQTSADLQYATVEGKEPLFAVNGMWMVSLIELPTLNPTIERTYNYGSPCIFCLDNQSTCRAVPCNHYFTCEKCVNKLPMHVKSTCPMCRTPTEKIAVMASSQEELYSEFCKPVTLSKPYMNMTVSLKRHKYAEPRYIGHVDFDEVPLSNSAQTVYIVKYLVPPKDLVYVHFTNLSLLNKKNYSANRIIFQYSYVGDYSATLDKFKTIDEEPDVETMHAGNTFDVAYPLQKPPGEPQDGWMFYFYDSEKNCKADTLKTEFKQKLIVVFEVSESAETQEIVAPGESMGMGYVWTDGLQAKVDFSRLYL